MLEGPVLQFNHADSTVQGLSQVKSKKLTQSSDLIERSWWFLPV